MINPSWYPSKKQLRQFAAICLPGFALIGWLSFRQGRPTAAYVCWSIGVAAFLVGMPFPDVLRPLYAVLMAITLPIGWLVSAVFLRVIFYLVFTPVGLVFRMMRRDPLRLTRPTGDTYWLDHEQRTDLASYYRQS